MVSDDGERTMLNDPSVADFIGSERRLSGGDTSVLGLNARILAPTTNAWLREEIPRTDLEWIVLDLSDPSFASLVDEDLARAWQRRGAGLVIKATRREWSRVETRTNARGLWVIITNGPDEVEVLSSEGSIRFMPPTTDLVLDSTGAGDAFVGALGHYLANGDPVERAARQATHAAVAFVTDRDAGSDH
jgi:sugar/nucleoside kinase (ribokinase family)